MLENFEGKTSIPNPNLQLIWMKFIFVTEIVKLAKGEHDSQLSRMTQCEQDTFEMHVRAANIVRAGESLMKLVSDIKQYLILNDFPSVNEAITQNSKLFRWERCFYNILVAMENT